MGRAADGLDVEPEAGAGGEGAEVGVGSANRGFKGTGVAVGRGVEGTISGVCGGAETGTRVATERGSAIEAGAGAWVAVMQPGMGGAGGSTARGMGVGANAPAADELALPTDDALPFLCVR